MKVYMDQLSNAISDLYWEMLELGCKMKRVGKGKDIEIKCSYPKDTGYGKLPSHIMDDCPIRDLIIKYIK